MMGVVKTGRLPARVFPIPLALPIAPIREYLSKLARPTGV